MKQISILLILLMAAPAFSAAAPTTSSNLWPKFVLNRLKTAKTVADYLGCETEHANNACYQLSKKELGMNLPKVEASAEKIVIPSRKLTLMPTADRSIFLLNGAKFEILQKWTFLDIRKNLLLRLKEKKTAWSLLAPAPAFAVLQYDLIDSDNNISVFVGSLIVAGYIAKNCDDAVYYAEQCSNQLAGLDTSLPRRELLSKTIEGVREAQLALDKLDGRFGDLSTCRRQDIGSAAQKKMADCEAKLEELSKKLKARSEEEYARDLEKALKKQRDWQKAMEAEAAAQSRARSATGDSPATRGHK